jgi:hypothetical protein
MNMRQVPVPWRDASGVLNTTLITVSDSTAAPGRPYVILLHGTSGDWNHMDMPDVRPGQNYDVDTFFPQTEDFGWWFWPNAGIASIGPDALTGVTGWRQTLNDLGYPTVNYSQIDKDGTLTRPAAELTAVVRAVMGMTTRHIAFVCHSRGGLLLRVFLQRNRNDLTLLRRIAGAVTLHSPHQGSGVADMATTIHNILVIWRWVLSDPVWQAAFGWFDQQICSPAIIDQCTNSGFLQQLRASEATPLPVSIPVHTFGGTSSRLTRLRTYWFDPMSAVPQYHWPPFHWTAFQTGIAGMSSVVDGSPLTTLAPEEGMGVGDLLVTDARSRLPWEASHHTTALNHAQALWHHDIKAQVTPILATFPG